jgi:hypothetical protein
MFRPFGCCHAPQGLRGLAENTHEGPAHPLLISKSGFSRDHFDRMSALRDHQVHRFEPQAFDRLGGRRASLVPKSPTELARTCNRAADTARCARYDHDLAGKVGSSPRRDRPGASRRRRLRHGLACQFLRRIVCLDRTRPALRARRPQRQRSSRRRQPSETLAAGCPVGSPFPLHRTAAPTLRRATRSRGFEFPLRLSREISRRSGSLGEPPSRSGVRVGQQRRLARLRFRKSRNIVCRGGRGEA